MAPGRDARIPRYSKNMKYYVRISGKYSLYSSANQREEKSKGDVQGLTVSFSPNSRLQPCPESSKGVVLQAVLEHVPQRAQERLQHQQIRHCGMSDVVYCAEGVGEAEWAEVGRYDGDRDGGCTSPTCPVRDSGNQVRMEQNGSFAW